MSLTPQQLQVLKTVLRVGKQTGASPKEIKAAVETGLVESNLSNPSGGDADSAGWRQERASLYPNPTNVAASAKRFFQETHAVKDKYGSAGALAAAVQRPAAQYRGRYQQRSGDAESILSKFGTVGATPGAAGGGTRTSTSTTSNASDVAAANEKNQRLALVASYLSKSAPGSPLLQSAVLQPVAVPDLKTLSTTRTTKATGGTQAAAGSSGGGKGSGAALDWAKSTIGVSETGGPNRGKRVDSWEQRFNLKGQPWCAVFTSLAVTKGGVAASGRTPSVAEVRRQAQQGTAAYQRGFIPPKQAQAGDLILFGNDHIGMVESVGKDGITMIAGNDSDKVQRRVVPLGSGDIVRPKYKR